MAVCEGGSEAHNREGKMTEWATLLCMRPTAAVDKTPTPNKKGTSITITLKNFNEFCSVCTCSHFLSDLSDSHAIDPHGFGSMNNAIQLNHSFMNRGSARH